MKTFNFKEFTVAQDKAAMKIGTDGVLLGAWTSLEHEPDSILDIGSGTGLIGLMLAQRSDAMTIDAVELDENAYEQSVENFENSPWGDRLFCYHAEFTDFAEQMCEEQETYDSIVSNPPFYSEDIKSESEDRNTARFTSSLSFKNLINGVAQLLSENGIFSVIVPKKEEINFIKIANASDLFLKRICEVKGNPKSEVKRVLLEFSKKQSEIQTSMLTIELERHQYTQEYINLTKDFYLKM